MTRGSVLALPEDPRDSRRSRRNRGGDGLPQQLLQTANCVYLELPAGPPGARLPVPVFLEILMGTPGPRAEGGRHGPLPACSHLSRCAPSVCTRWIKLLLVS